MNWVKSITDSNGIKMLCPPMPAWDKIPVCSMCGAKTQFLHFWPEVLSLLEPDDQVPSFCDANCARRFIDEIQA